MIQFQENTQTENRMAGPTEYNKYNFSRLALKNKDIEYDAGLIKNYCITVSM